MSLRQKIEQNKQNQIVTTPQQQQQQQQHPLSSSFHYQQNDPTAAIPYTSLQQQPPIQVVVPSTMIGVPQQQVISYAYPQQSHQQQFIGQPIFYQTSNNNQNHQILKPNSSQIFQQSNNINVSPQQNYSPKTFLRKQNQEIPQQIQQIQSKIDETSNLVNAIQLSKKNQVLEDTEAQLNLESLARENQMLHKHLQERLDDILVWKNNYEKLQKQFKEMNLHWESAQKQILDVQQAAQKQIIENQKRNFSKEMKGLKEQVTEIEQKLQQEKNDKQNVIMEFTEYKRQFNVETQSMNSLIERINQYDSVFRQSEVNYNQYKEKMELIERGNKRKIEELSEKINELTEQKKYYFEKFEEKFQKKKTKIQTLKRQLTVLTQELQQRDQFQQIHQFNHNINNKIEPKYVSDPIYTMPPIIHENMVPNDQQQFQKQPSFMPVPIYQQQQPPSLSQQPPLQHQPLQQFDYHRLQQEGGTRTQLYDKFIQDQIYNNNKKPFLYEYQNSKQTTPINYASTLNKYY